MTRFSFNNDTGAVLSPYHHLFLRSSAFDLYIGTAYHRVTVGRVICSRCCLLEDLVVNVVGTSVTDRCSRG